mmetsp:Transcript_11208/g.20508  ORF Transcript_11208/g.20508 Transcript_11208/m.20508 type:complete len:426 (+) Transcript_11208:221-1498(+)
MWENETRYIVAFLLCMANMICYADRTNIGIAAPSFLPDPGDRGLILSSFFYGYILTQIPASFWAVRHGVKAVLVTGVIVWTICDVSTIFVSESIPRLVIVRACMGAGEGVVMPSLHHFAANWFPSSERSTLVAVISSGSDLGTILALFLSPCIMKWTHWTMIFVTFGGFSIVWVLVFLRHVTSKPEQHARISIQEKEYIRSTSQSSTSRNMPWSVAFGHKSIWAIYIAHFSFNYSWYVLLGWLPSYFKEELGLDLKENHFLAAFPYICGYCGLIVAGRISDHLIARGIRTLYVRRMMNTISSVFPAVFLFALKYVHTPRMAILCLSAALFTGRASTSGYWINMIDIGPEYAGQIMGVSNTIATIPGILGNLITGYILKQTNNWAIVFDVAAGVSLFGGIVFALFSTDRNVFQKKEKEYTSFLEEI